MQLERKRKWLEHWSHTVHHITLVLVGIAFLLSFIPAADVANVWLEERLHVAHLTLLGLVILQLGVFLIFSRSVGKENAKLLAQHSSPLPNPPDSSKQVYFPNSLPIPAGTYQFVNAKTGKAADTLQRLSLEGTDRTPFEMDPKELELRNRGLIETNPQVFMLVKDAESNSSSSSDFIGYTCVLPLNAAGEDYYLNGILKDKDVRSSLLAKPGETSATLLLFAIVLAEQFRKSDRGPELMGQLFRYADHHIRTVAAEHPRVPETLVWIQLAAPALASQLTARGFGEAVGKKSGDGFPLYSRALNLTGAV